jgi:hypothetical protein
MLKRPSCVLGLMSGDADDLYKEVKRLAHYLAGVVGLIIWMRLSTLHAAMFSHSRSHSFSTLETIRIKKLLQSSLVGAISSFGVCDGLSQTSAPDQFTDIFEKGGRAWRGILWDAWKKLKRQLKPSRSDTTNTAILLLFITFSYSLQD